LARIEACSFHCQQDILVDLLSGGMFGECYVLSRRL